MGLRIECLQKLYFKHKIATEIADKEILKFVQEEYMVLISDIFKGNKEDLDYLIELGKELQTQDNLGTRKPLIFKIQDVRAISCEEGLEDFVKIDIYDFNGSLHLFTNNEIQEAVTFIQEAYSYDEEVGLDSVIDIDALISFCEDYGIQHKVHYYQYENYYSGEFLTRKAAKAHLEKFKHRYSSDARLYIACGVDNEEIVKLTEVLERLYEMNCKEEL